MTIFSAEGAGAGARRLGATVALQPRGAPADADVRLDLVSSAAL